MKDYKMTLNLDVSRPLKLFKALKQMKVLLKKFFQKILGVNDVKLKPEYSNITITINTMIP